MLGRTTGKHYSNLVEIELTDLERGALDKAIGREDDFFNYLQSEILNRPPVPPLDHYVANAAFVIGGLSACVNFFIGKDCAHILGAGPTASTVAGVGVVIPSIALEGNALHDIILHLAHYFFHQKYFLPHKNNRPHLRRLAKSFVYISNIALGILAAYIHMNFLKVPLGMRYALLPGNFISNTVVDIEPFNEVMNDLFAQYSPGLTEQTRLKRTILTASLKHALKKIRTFDGLTYAAFYQEMTAPIHSMTETKARWNKILSLDDQKCITDLKKSMVTLFRGGVGRFFAALCTLTNIAICYEASDWLADIFGIDNMSFYEAIGAILSVLCCTSYGVLCAGPTQRAFEGESETLGWEPTHPLARKCMRYVVSPILGGLTAATVAFWPLYLGKTAAEKALSGPALISAGTLFRSVLCLLLYRLIDAFDRWCGNDTPSNHLAFLAALDTLERAVLQLPDDVVEAVLPTEHPLYIEYVSKIVAEQAQVRRSSLQ